MPRRQFPPAPERPTRSPVVARSSRRGAEHRSERGAECRPAGIADRRRGTRRRRALRQRGQRLGQPQLPPPLPGSSCRSRAGTTAPACAPRPRPSRRTPPAPGWSAGSASNASVTRCNRGSRHAGTEIGRASALADLVQRQRDDVPHRPARVPHHRLLAGGQDQFAQQRRNRDHGHRRRPGSGGILAQEQRPHRSPVGIRVTCGVRAGIHSAGAGRHDEQRGLGRHAHHAVDRMQQLRAGMLVPAAVVAIRGSRTRSRPAAAAPARRAVAARRGRLSGLRQSMAGHRERRQPTVRGQDTPGPVA